MEKKDIKTREDIFKLVSTFYAKVRVNETLAPFFDRIDDWDEHLERLTTFWESSLFLKTKYFGDPLKAHAKADKEHGNKISEYHFGVWLNLWFETIEELFKGETAENAKRRARKMGTFLYMQIFQARQNS
ncbi:group III truncated hemoglobin [Flavobacteriaceae bacterium S0825]|uniref:group III truncated hemoglobin n=1 Tax=Gaetbulibacter sp. S0825 TaxID=2720084 RepID=UPI00142F7810|nr:group III truncated hemoglobin [Gaetbulibacter sp. S0825]MCK0109412.1 group III truncated hemoglobin [Flavobacteriaceae bacterium S0825]NIX65046.1 group III truncated hemoglobin [Gaetbulibacter sp. S0825]